MENAKPNSRKKTMSGFKSLLEEKIKPSLFEQVDAKLDEESKKDFYEALYNEKISAKLIAEVLNSFEIKVSKTAIVRWRKIGMQKKKGA